MSVSQIFLASAGTTAILSFLAVAYLKPHLKRILIDLCGTEERASFWTAFSNVALVLMPLIFAMHYRPGAGPETSPVLEMGTQLEWALIGLVASVLVLGFVVSMFIPRRPAGQ
ncbi:MAG TPA: hypothetical protein VKU44_02130 [Terriglobia bacterium]|nr:hypothetical protein [Terriglobia bacterium]